MKRLLVDSVLDVFFRRFSNYSPNTLSVISFSLALISATLFALSSKYPLLMAIGSISVLLSGIFDILDGKVARTNKLCSVKGDYLDHTFDRLSDVLILAGLTFSCTTFTKLGIIAIASTVISSYVSTLAICYGVKRVYGGVLNRLRRMWAIIVVSMVQSIIWTLFDPHIISNITLIDLLLMGIIIGSLLTTFQRVVFVLTKLDN